MGATLLDAHDASVHFQGLRALDGVNLSVDELEVLGLIGPNGAGKTTLLNVLCGFQRMTRGTIAFDSRPIARLPPYRISRLGVSRTFQDGRLFRGLTVLENVELGQVGQGAGRRASLARASEVIGWLGLEERMHELAGDQPFGIQRRVGIARALAMRPRLLLLDEPAAGLNEAESAELTGLIRRIRDDFGCAVLVIEHDMHVILNACERVHVLDHGQTLSVGTPDEIRRDPEVVRAYLGSLGAAETP
jgi:branched-chain amino acid transport system ATP-binding protein